VDLLFARSQMAMSLGFHIIFAACGMAMPLFMVIAEARYLRTRDPEDLRLARTWAKGTAVVFAVGAVSGTVLSFELGLLFPEFMRQAGPVIGMPFSLEGFAFFAEGIFLGLYLYGWDRLRPAAHLASGVVVALAGVASAGFVLIANAWMNAPVAVVMVDGQLRGDPIRALATPFAAHEILHMALAAYLATGLAAAALHALALLRAHDSVFHRRALGIALWVALPCAIAQPVVGHHAGQMVARHQPMKLAAIEQLEHTRRHAPISLGPIRVPSALSLFAYGDPNAEVKGLDKVPPVDRPPMVVRPAFQLMVALSLWFVFISMWVGALGARRKPLADERWLLKALVITGPLGFVAIEAGWVVTEVGRQPWVIYGLLRTANSVTPMPGLWIPLTTFTLVYLGLAAAVLLILSRQLRATLEVRA
jgi:cytochrome d ubiquinol oxidase subunit I